MTEKIPEKTVHAGPGGALSTKRKAEQALGQRVLATLDRDRRADALADVVVPTVSADNLAAALEDIRGGDGGELVSRELDDGTLQRPKLHSAYSSAGLALNTFGPWRLDPGSLLIGTYGDFATLQFEQQLRIFRGGHAPNLDVVLTAPGRVLAIESKLTEHLGKKQAPIFSDAYNRRKESSDPSWWDLYEHLREGRVAFTYLDAAQLVKHYFGLKKYCEGNPLTEATLVYLYWEPQDADAWPELQDHRSEVEKFAHELRDPQVAFETLTYLDLWSSWEGLTSPPWLGTHLDELRRRYALRIGE